MRVRCDTIYSPVHRAGPLNARFILEDLAWTKTDWPGSYVNQISKTYKNNIRSEISPLVSQPSLPSQPFSGPNNKDI
jgi:hypothetical protein